MTEEDDVESHRFSVMRDSVINRTFSTANKFADYRSPNHNHDLTAGVRSVRKFNLPQTDIKPKIMTRHRSALNL